MILDRFNNISSFFVDCLLIVIIIVSPFLYHPFYVVVVACEVDCGWGTLRIEDIRNYFSYF